MGFRYLSSLFGSFDVSSSFNLSGLSDLAPRLAIDKCRSTLVAAFCLSYLLAGGYSAEVAKATPSRAGVPASSLTSPTSPTASSAFPEASPSTSHAAADQIVLHFPKGKPVGKLLLLTKGKHRDIYSETFYAMAQGDISVSRGAIFLLNVNYQGARDLSSLNKLPPGVIAGLRMARIAITDEQFMALDGMKYMKILDFTDLDITDRGFMHIKECKGLLELTLGSSLVTGKGLEAVRDLQQLVSLSLSQSNLGDASLTNVGCLKHLADLRLKGVNIGDAGVAQIKNLSHLRKLVVSSNKRITDVSIPYIVALSNLKRLDVTDCKITAAGLMQLKKLLDLRQLSFDFKDYTVGQIDQIKHVLPEHCRLTDGRSSSMPMEMFAPLH